MGMLSLIIDMRRLIARVARVCGWKTSYAITYTWPTRRGWAYCSQVIEAKPWLRSGDMKELNAMMREKATESGEDVTPNIINITRLGA